MIADATVRKTLGDIRRRYASEIDVTNDTKTYRIGEDLTVIEWLVTGSKFIGYETSGQRAGRLKRTMREVTSGNTDILAYLEKRHYRKGPPQLVTKDDLKRYNEERAKFEREGGKNKAMIVGFGPVVESASDTDLLTVSSERILVRYDGIDLNALYFDAPWWQGLINTAKKDYRVQVDRPEEGIPQEFFHRRPVGRMVLPPHHHPRIKLVFRLEVKTDSAAEKAIKSIWEAGDRIKRAVNSETSRLTGRNGRYRHHIHAVSPRVK